MSKDATNKTRILGNVGKLVQIHTVEGSVVVHTSSGPDPAELLQRGARLVENGAFEQAISVLNEAIALNPDMSKAYYYSALALLKGNRPKILTLSQVQSIEQKIQTACEIDDCCAHYFYLWAWLKCDFYKMNGFRIRPPTVETLVSTAESLPLDYSAAHTMYRYMQTGTNPVVSYFLRRLQTMQGKP